MQYILTEEEYKNLVSKEKYDDALDKIERLNKKVLESLRDGKEDIVIFVQYLILAQELVRISKNTLNKGIWEE